MKKMIFLCLLFCVNSANAALIHFTGNIQYHNDVIYTYFTLDNDATNVKVWTDSFKNGTNFDPITVLWNASTRALISQNDDNDAINNSQTSFDSGFSVDTLSAGEYVFTIATYPNDPKGSSLADGFSFDGQTPIDLASWEQPYSGKGMGSFWSVWLSGVDSASLSGSVPVPSSIALMLMGLLSVFTAKRKLTD